MEKEITYNGENENNVFKKDMSKVSDGYHTFEELYEHRVALWLALCKTDPDNVFFKKHYETWFVVFWESPVGQMSYHVPEHHWNFCMKHFKHDPNHEWDGHTSRQVLERLVELSR